MHTSTILRALKRCVPPLVVFTLAGCHLGEIPRRAITPTAMGETSYRIGLYYKKNNKLPATLDVLPIRENYVNSTADLWGRTLIYRVEPEDHFTLISLGKENLPGGAGEDSDLVQKYRFFDGEVRHVK